MEAAAREGSLKLGRAEQSRAVHTPAMHASCALVNEEGHGVGQGRGAWYICFLIYVRQEEGEGGSQCDPATVGFTGQKRKAGVRKTRLRSRQNPRKPVRTQSNPPTPAFFLASQRPSPPTRGLHFSHNTPHPVIGTIKQREPGSYYYAM